MGFEDFEGNRPWTPPPSDGGYRPPGLPPAYKPPEIVDRPPAVTPGTVVQAPVQEFKPIPENMFGFFMLLLGL